MNLEVVKNYYGKVLKSSEDLKTSACCDGGGVPSYLEPLLANVHEEVRAKYYGCGIIVPAALEGTRVLGLGPRRLHDRTARRPEWRGGRRGHDRRAARHSGSS
jgi:hypothetical protein